MCVFVCVNMYTSVSPLEADAGYIPTYSTVPPDALTTSGRKLHTWCFHEGLSEGFFPYDVVEGKW